MTGLSLALTILSSMITPAVLISACASLAISTSTRLSRAMDRTRKISDQFRQLGQTEATDSDEEVRMLYAQLRWAVARSRLLQQALTCLYLSLCVFVVTSVAIGLISITGEYLTGLPVALGLFGAGLLFYTSVLLIAEIRLARIAVNAELEYDIELGSRYAPKDLVEQLARRSRFFSR